MVEAKRFISEPLHSDGGCLLRCSSADSPSLAAATDSAGTQASPCPVISSRRTSRLVAASVDALQEVQVAEAARVRRERRRPVHAVPVLAPPAADVHVALRLPPVAQREPRSGYYADRA